MTRITVGEMMASDNSPLADELLGPAHVVLPGRQFGKTAQARRMLYANPGLVEAGPGDAVSFVILGEPVSHKNGYHIVTISNHAAIVKSKEAIDYELNSLRQIPPTARVRFEGPVYVEMTLYYTSERKDLDESLVLDVLQDKWVKRSARERLVLGPTLLQAGVYRNDRQVRDKRIRHAIDRANPRAEITVKPLTAQQALDLPSEAHDAN